MGNGENMRSFFFVAIAIIISLLVAGKRRNNDIVDYSVQNAMWKPVETVHGWEFE